MTNSSSAGTGSGLRWVDGGWPTKRHARRSENPCRSWIIWTARRPDSPVPGSESSLSPILRGGDFKGLDSHHAIQPNVSPLEFL